MWSTRRVAPSPSSYGRLSTCISREGLAQHKACEKAHSRQNEGSKCKQVVQRTLWFDYTGLGLDAIGTMDLNQRDLSTITLLRAPSQ